MTNISWKDSSEKLPINFLVDYSVRIVNSRELKGSIPGMSRYEDFQPISLLKVWPEIEHTFKKVRKDHPGFTIDSDKIDSDKKRNDTKKGKHTIKVSR